MKTSQILLLFEDIANKILTKDDHTILIDLCKKHKSYNIITENYKIFCQREKSTNVMDFAEWMEDVGKSGEFPVMPWEGEK